MKHILGWTALLCGVTASANAQAQSCWNQRAVEAAQIREFDIMLMVSALRCQVKGVDFVQDYNHFVAGNKATLIGVNDEIRAHLNAEMGGKAALEAYDRFSTAIANRYGNGGGMDQDCEGLRAIAVNATASGADSTRAFLLANAQRVGVDPDLAGGRCGAPVQVASAEPALVAQRIAPAPVVPAIEPAVEVAAAAAPLPQLTPIDAQAPAPQAAPAYAQAPAPQPAPAYAQAPAPQPVQERAPYPAYAQASAPQPAPAYAQAPAAYYAQAPQQAYAPPPPQQPQSYYYQQAPQPQAYYQQAPRPYPGYYPGYAQQPYPGYGQGPRGSWGY